MFDIELKINKYFQHLVKEIKTIKHCRSKKKNNQTLIHPNQYSNCLLSKSVKLNK